jgi:hypothetical protein
MMFDSPCHGLVPHVGYGSTLTRLRYPLQTADDSPPQQAAG